MDIIAQITSEFHLQAWQVENVVKLVDEGNTIPFIARYRKEAHGTLDDQVLREISERLEYLRNLDKRREEVRASIEGQEKLTEEIAAALSKAVTLAEIEDIYRPFKPKRRTRASIAREKGLEPLAQVLYEQRPDSGEPLALALASSTRKGRGNGRRGPQGRARHHCGKSFRRCDDPPQAPQPLYRMRHGALQGRQRGRQRLCALL